MNELTADTITDEQIEALLHEAERAGDHDLADYAEVALGRHDATGGLTDPAHGGRLSRVVARQRCVDAINARAMADA
jgi:hypothetical protein